MLFVFSMPPLFLDLFFFSFFFFLNPDLFFNHSSHFKKTKNRLAPCPREAGQAPFGAPDRGAGLPDPGPAGGLGDAGGGALGQREFSVFLLLFFPFFSFPPVSPLFSPRRLGRDAFDRHCDA